VPKDGEMRVTGIQAKKISKHKAVLVVKFLAPASLKDTEIQLFCTSLEPNTRLGQGADLTLLTAIRKTHPHAKTLHDIGVRQMSDADTTRVLLAHSVLHDSHKHGPDHRFRAQRRVLDSSQTKKMLSTLTSMGGGTFFDATQIDSVDDETSERNPHCEGFNVRAASDPDGYTRATPDPKHHGQAMRSSLRVEWIKSQALEMQGLWNRGVFHKVLCTSLAPQDRVFSSYFHYKIKRKGGGFDSAKSAL